MGLQPKPSLANIRRQRHVCCDCEIIFNLGAPTGWALARLALLDPATVDTSRIHRNDG
jgi:hypothetical protein